jgi:hypothetical protein
MESIESWRSRWGKSRSRASGSCQASVGLEVADVDRPPDIWREKHGVFGMVLACDIGVPVRFFTAIGFFKGVESANPGLRGETAPLSPPTTL